MIRGSFILRLGAAPPGNDSCDTKFVGCTNVPWFQNRVKYCTSVADPGEDVVYAFPHQFFLVLV